MPSGKTHDRITLWALPAVLAAAFYLTLDVPLTVIICIGFLIGGFMMGPDLDIHSVQYNRWGPIKWIWYPYQVTLKHRSHWSHGPVIGTVLRVLYFAVWVGLFGLVIVEVLNRLWNAQLTWQELKDATHIAFSTYLWEWLALLIGLELGALSHYVSDWTGSGIKRRFKKKSKRRRSGKRR
ncbi:MAG: metal-binding protein [Cyanobacteria bacterium J06632_22]